jgi:dipeptidyl aminopeptidase/acylaminoacyl peptidase
MAKRLFKPEDTLRLKAVADPDLSPDGRRVAFALVESEEEKDRLRTSIWIAPADASSPPRRFSEGPADANARFSPDGRWLAYISAPEEHPEQAHVRLAPLEGGVPSRLGELPGPVLQLAWAPDSRRLVVVCRVGIPPRDEADATRRNAPRLVRGLAARTDGIGWQEGRRHLFLIDVEDGSTRQLTRGEFDHGDPSFSPDGNSVVCASDRSRRRDDRQFRSDAWIIPVTRGRPRRLTGGRGWVISPQFSPDGSTVAFAGQLTDAWDEDPHVFVVPVDGSGPPEQVAPKTDRPASLMAGPSLHWSGGRELAILVADRGAVRLHRARPGDARSREVVGGEIQIDGFAVGGRRSIAFTGAWVDRPSEVYVMNRAGAEPVRVSNFNDQFVADVELAPAGRSSIAREDGTEVEYFTLMPPNRGGRAPVPLHLDVHGGPHGWWPLTLLLAFHQAIAAAGYCVLLPNPRGSAGYGQSFTSGCTGDWGGGDYEDVLACCDDLVTKEIADPRRMFVSGYSYGGFMTAWIVGHTDRFRAGTAGAAVIDQTSMALTTDVSWFSQYSMGGTPWERSEEYEKRSPLTYLPEVKTPVLVVHWEGDVRVPIGQGEELYTGLRLLGKEVELLRYPGGFHAHWAPSQMVDFTRQILSWNERHDVRAPGRRR